MVSASVVSTFERKLVLDREENRRLDQESCQDDRQDEEQIFLNINKNYYIVRNAGCAHSRYTLKLYLKFFFNELIN